MRHIPVLLAEVIEALKPEPGHACIDATLGDGGHAEKLLEHSAPTGRLLGFDADPESLLRAQHTLNRFSQRFIGVRENFQHMLSVAQAHEFTDVQSILIDLGWSSPQFEERGRGFSFLKPNEPLDMRYDTEVGESAAHMVNSLPEQDLAVAFAVYGEETLGKQIAKEIVTQRREHPIKTVADLVTIILNVYRVKLGSQKEIPWIGGLHPATKVFQALRIAVNDELGVLKAVIPQAISLLAKGGRLAIITFHSGEDRIVKHAFIKLEKEGKGKVITKKPIIPGEVEVKNNPRAASAKLRIFQTQ